MTKVQVTPLLNGKVVIVTGGAGLLGRTFCSAIASAGGVAVIADTAIENARKIADEISNLHPGSAICVEMDITSRESIVRAIEFVHQQHGKIDAIVNNAYPRNANYGRRLEEVSYEDFCHNVSMHAGGYFLVMQQFSVYFQPQGYGNIVNMSSIYGSMAPRFSIYGGTAMTMPIEYAAIKSGIEHLTRYFAQYLKGSNIRVNSLSPGGILDRQPQSFLDAYGSHCTSKGMLNAEDLTGSMIYLLSDMSRHVVGQNLIVDDGFSL